jgi:hypothetical protein
VEFIARELLRANAFGRVPTTIFPANVLVAVVEVAINFSATTPPAPTTESGAYGDVVPIPRFPLESHVLPPGKYELPETENWVVDACPRELRPVTVSVPPVEISVLMVVAAEADVPMTNAERILMSILRPKIVFFIALFYSIFTSTSMWTSCLTTLL